jgi:biopolymer transport protein ExbB
MRWIALQRLGETPPYHPQMLDGAIDSLSSVMVRGGWVMWPLMLLSVISVTLCLERGWLWLHLHSPARRRRFNRLNTALRSGSRAEAERLAGKSRRLVYSALATRLLVEKPTDALAVEAVEELRTVVERFMPTLSTIITAAPLLGILGTVTGLISSFELLGTSRMITDPREISGGIAEALISTAAGLIVALVTLFPYMIFKGHVERAYRRMESIIASAQHGASEPAGKP